MILLDHKAECARSSMFFHVVDGLVWATCPTDHHEGAPMTTAHTVVLIDVDVRFPTPNPHLNSFVAFVLIDDEDQVQVRHRRSTPHWACAQCGPFTFTPACIHTVAAQAAVTKIHNQGASR